MDGLPAPAARGADGRPASDPYGLSSVLACSLAFFNSASAGLPCITAFMAFGRTFLACSNSPQPELIGVNLVLPAISVKIASFGSENFTSERIDEKPL